MKRISRHPYPEKTKKQAIDLYNSGQSISDISKSLKISYFAIQNWLIMSGAYSDYPPRPLEEARPQAIKLYQSGQPIIAIAKSLGISYGVVRDWVIKEKRSSTMAERDSVIEQDNQCDQENSDHQEVSYRDWWQNKAKEVNHEPVFVSLEKLLQEFMEEQKEEEVITEESKPQLDRQQQLKVRLEQDAEKRRKKREVSLFWEKELERRISEQRKKEGLNIAEQCKPPNQEKPLQEKRKKWRELGGGIHWQISESNLQGFNSLRWAYVQSGHPRIEGIYSIPIGCTRSTQELLIGLRNHVENSIRANTLKNPEAMSGRT